ncbi:hypothetical protein PISMIDRAFT_686095 [Pisolithus microcarpus 441]|uniref:Uncharacterized protein n=1 Tax=Pisolithus microcarpus 441 TaxID=765257 RepID=A0A0C9YJ39_9AGAM|nr:hypothetical protein PISMIDRAFT_686095 [Pisolithus microcarpus 441]
MYRSGGLQHDTPGPAIVSVIDIVGWLFGSHLVTLHAGETDGKKMCPPQSPPSFRGASHAWPDDAAHRRLREATYRELTKGTLKSVRIE